MFCERQFPVARAAPYADSVGIAIESGSLESDNRPIRARIDMIRSVAPIFGMPFRHEAILTDKFHMNIQNIDFAKRSVLSRTESLRDEKEG